MWDDHEIRAVKLRRHLTFANVVACLALFVALGGASYAATQLPRNSVGAAQLKKNSVTGSKVRNGSLSATDLKAATLRKLKGPRGPAGAPGARGLQGPPGEPGHTGASGSAVLTARFTNESLMQTLFGPVSGIGPKSNTDESAVVELSPPVPVVARDLSAQYVESAMPGGRREFFLMVDGSATALRCSYTTPASSCRDTTDSVTIPPESSIAIKFVQGGSNIGGGDVLTGFRSFGP